MPRSCPMWSPTWRNSAHTSDSGSCDPTPLASSVGVTDRIRLSLGYEPSDDCLCRLRQPVVIALASARLQREVVSDPRRAAAEYCRCQQGAAAGPPGGHRQIEASQPILYTLSSGGTC